MRRRCGRTGPVARGRRPAAGALGRGMKWEAGSLRPAASLSPRMVPNPTTGPAASALPDIPEQGYKRPQIPIIRTNPYLCVS